MNDKLIKKLADEAEFSEKDLHIQNDNFQKLAELIVKECVQFIDEENIRLCEYQNSLPEWDGNRRDDCDLVIEKCIDLADKIKQHFGVKE